MTMDQAVEYLKSKNWTVRQSKLTGKYQVYDASGRPMFCVPQTAATVVASVRFWKKNSTLYFK